MTHRRRARVAAGLAAVGALVVVLSGLDSRLLEREVARAATVTKVAVTISVRLDARGRGTFTLRGGLADQGAASARRAVVGGRLQTTLRLNGAKGVIVVTSSQACRRTSGTWRVVSGTSAYLGVTGNGLLPGRAACSRPFGPTTVVHRGAVDVPPVALVQAGPWGGWTSQDKALTFTVTPDGRAIADVLVGTHRRECVRSDGLRTPSFWEDTAYPGPFAIADDRTFRFEVGSGVGATTIDGRFTGTHAEGTIRYSNSYPPDAQGRTTSCAGSIPWTATTPPPPPRRALVGRYCGFAREGEGVCLEVSEAGRELRNLEVGLFLDCNDTGFYGRLKYDAPVRIQSDLSFRAAGTATIEVGSAVAFLSGTFDEAGGVSGVLTLQQPSFTYEGARYSCRNSSATFTARLQR